MALINKTDSFKIMLSREITFMDVFRGKIIPVIRMTSAENAQKAVEILFKAGMRIFELTLTTPKSLELIESLRQQFPEAVIGAGTVLSTVEFHDAKKANAQFFVSPHSSEEIGRVCNAYCELYPFFLGAATATEVYTAHRAKAKAVKLFPAAQLGGVSMVKALKAVFPDIPIMPTGGISLDQAADYFKAGAVAVGMGGELADEKAIINGDYERLANAAARAVEIEKSLAGSA